MPAAKKSKTFCLYLSALLALIFSQLQAAAQTFELTGGGLASLWESESGRLVSLKSVTPGSGPEGYSFFADSQGTGGFEVFDELEGKRYSDRNTPAAVSDLRFTRVGTLQKVEFTKRFAGAPFVIECTFTADAEGLHLETATRLIMQEDLRWPGQRNLRVSFVLPAGAGLLGWAPSYPEPALLHEKPIRYCYGIQEPGLPRTGIPLYTVYDPQGAGLSICMPLEMPKVQLNLGPEPEDPACLYVPVALDSPNAGASLSYLSQPQVVKPEDVRVVRFTELFVGLSADRPLRFGIWLYTHRPHWRPALGRLAEAYPDYFSVHPRMRSVWGSRLGSNVHLSQEELDSFKRFGATMAWLHTHFHRHGEFIPPEAVNDPDFVFFCEPYARQYPDNTLRKNRIVIDRLTDNGQAVFLYGFNMHCDTVTVVQRGLSADVTRNQDGSVTRAYHDQPVMFFNPESPFGIQQLKQMDLMIQLYPRISGIALDNWAYGGIDFAHDDGITMFGHKPAANVNFSQQRMIEAIARKWHAGGRLVMVNKSRTIESLKGMDSMLSEASGAEIFAIFAYMCLDRHLHPNEYDAADDAKYAEQTLQYTLEWGGQIGQGQCTADPEMTWSYFTLIQALRNRTWVFDPDPLSLPEGTRGNIWRIHPADPWHPGDIVVAVVRPEVRFAERRFKQNLKVKVRLPEAGRIARASWLSVENHDKPAVACEITRDKEEVTVSLPPVGAAGVLRLVLKD